MGDTNGEQSIDKGVVTDGVKGRTQVEEDEDGFCAMKGAEA